MISSVPSGSSVELLSIVEILAWIIGGGALGGILDYFSRFEMHVDNKKLCFQGVPIKSHQFFSLLVISAALGIGGALAIQFSMISVGKFDSAATSESIMWILTTSVVAGFSGRRILNLVSNKLEDQIGESNRNAGEAKEEAGVAKDKAEENLLITRAVASLGDKSTASERIQVGKEIKQFLSKKPTNRHLAILGGRVHRKDNYYREGIKVLTLYVDAKDKLNERDKDYADVHYNRACYWALVASTQSDNNEIEQKECLDNLKIAVALSSENASDAKTDSDFNSVKELAEFKGIIDSATSDKT
ncbi:MAG: hypothetical protein ACI8WB_003720 [Phenylobacterium sp.]|jgi:hypothetical protein